MNLESKAQQSLRFWMTSSLQSNVKNYKKVWTLIQSCIEKYSSIEVNLNPVPMQFGPSPNAIWTLFKILSIQ